ncbi:MAG: recombinase family protein [Alphaproteobacteria bacterium]|nr:recombinase family protein [Alphaproteobacteria bacterium]
MNRINCAIYCRKSTERGLEQEFNSLDNQELACKSYIASQTFQGWGHYKTYSDGGISGGTMARPGLKEMLDDIRLGKVQIVLVYKIDRLSRSIYDFKRMMKEDFEKHDCNLVSITQSFDTSTAMGKLTLNMLLSFAEFEREVASERVRDKMLATKAKGLWVGGKPPLGYDIEYKKLIPNDVEVQIVREIFETYLSVPSLFELRQALIKKRITAKRWITKNGNAMGGNMMNVSTLANLLRNKVYIGKLPNKTTGDVFDGQHQAILDQKLFEKVQAKLTDNNRHKNTPYTRGTPLLHQKIYTADGKMFVNRKGNRGVKKYRYYKIGKVSLPAGDMDNIVRDTLKKFLDSNLSYLPQDKKLAFKQTEFSDVLVRPMVDKIVYHDNKLTMFINADDLSYLAPFKNDRINHIAEPLDNSCLSADGKHTIIEKQIVVNKFPSKSNRYIGSGTAVLTKTDNANNLILALAYGWRYRKAYEAGTGITDLEKQERRNKRTLYKYLNLAYLSPKIIGAIMDSEIPAHVNLQTLFAIASKYEDFNKQETVFFGS